jgi:hypothetical protein
MYLACALDCNSLAWLVWINFRPDPISAPTSQLSDMSYSYCGMDNPEYCGREPAVIECYVLIECAQSAPPSKLRKVRAINQSGSFALEVRF